MADSSPGSSPGTAQSLTDLVSDAVVAVETRRADADISRPLPQLLHEERQALGRVSDGRRRDYTLGRWCARQALETLGHAPVPILSGPKREPLWPSGIVGSITHTRGYVAAAVAPATRLTSIGIDAESDEPLPDGVIHRVARAEELAWAAPNSGPTPSPGPHPDRLLFCAKEAVYKAWYPLARRWLGFGDASLTIDPASQTFRAEILVDGPVHRMQGRYGTAGGILLAVVELPVELGPNSHRR